MVAIPAAAAPVTVVDRFFQVFYWCAYRAARAWWFLRRPPQRGAIVALWHGRRVLLIRNSYTWFWSAPGGSVGRGEAPAAAAARELREEIGLELPPGALRLAMEVEHFWQYRHDRVHVFEAELAAAPALRLDNREVVEARFIDPESIDPAALLPHLRDYLAARRARSP
jgi:8-oxo-dGTP pyrophosphatase MutT (NUDIX family)